MGSNVRYLATRPRVGDGGELSLLTVESRKAECRNNIVGHQVEDMYVYCMDYAGND